MKERGKYEKKQNAKTHKTPQTPGSEWEDFAAS